MGSQSDITHWSERLNDAYINYCSIVDNDIIEATNLQRQILYLQEDIGLPKVDVVEKKTEINKP